MQKKSTGLGRGLGALLKPTPMPTTFNPNSPRHLSQTQAQSDADAASPASEDSLSVSKGLSSEEWENASHAEARADVRAALEAAARLSEAGSPIELPTAQLKPMPGQPRQHLQDETIDSLAASIKTYGIIQPLVVMKDEKGSYRIIAGERRWRAAKRLGFETVPCIIRKPSEQPELELALIENIQREDLSPVDEARTLQKLLEEYRYTHESLAGRIGRDRTFVSNSIRLLSLPIEVLEDLNTQLLSAGHARAMCALEDRKQILKVRDVVLKKKLSVRQTETLVKSLKRDAGAEPKALGDKLSPDLRYLCDQFKGHLGTKVRISGDSQRGKIEISYYTLEDLDRISELMLGNPLRTNS